MKAWGLTFAQAAPAAPPAPEVAAPPVLTPVASPQPIPPSMGGAPVLAPTPAAPRPAPAPQAHPQAAQAHPQAQATARAPQAAAPAQAPAAPRAAPARPAQAPPARPAPARNPDYADELASRYGTREFPLRSTGRVKRSRTALVTTVSAALVLTIVLAGLWYSSAQRKQRAVDIERLLRQTRELLEKDSYASYKEAGQKCEQIFERDPDAVGGHAYTAYVDAIRWGEHGESEALRDEAKKHLEALDRLGLHHSHAYAAAAYLKFYGGDAKGAIDDLRAVLAGPENASALLHGVLGILEMQAGDLDGARQDLELGRRIAQGDVRITQMLAEQWRRRGQGFELQAAALYDNVLTRLEPDHVPSMLGKAQLLLDSGRGDEALKLISRVLDTGPKGLSASPRQVALAHVLRGSALFGQGKKDEGAAEEQQALALDPSNAEIHDLVGRRKQRTGDSAGAAEDFQKAIQLDPARLSFYIDLAGALMQRPGGARQAVAALERANARAANARVTKLLGDAYLADGDRERAQAAYERAIGMEKHFVDANVALARLFRDRKEYRKAFDQLDRAAKEYTGESAGVPATLYVEMAETEEAGGAPAELIEKSYTSAIKADPKSCPALFWLGRSRSVKKPGAVFDRPLALQMLADYLKTCPSGPRAAEAQQIIASLR
jgi:tetratricopeptide (TPR) repeat protein